MNKNNNNDNFLIIKIESVDAVPVWQLIIHPYYYMGKTKPEDDSNNIILEFFKNIITAFLIEFLYSSIINGPSILLINSKTECSFNKSRFLEFLSSILSLKPVDADVSLRKANIKEIPYMLFYTMGFFSNNYTNPLIDQLYSSAREILTMTRVLWGIEPKTFCGLVPSTNHQDKPGKTKIINKK
ncbi:hypothetical protein H8356DRAFT_1434372 [Neocallimastix lanati (nom. inval.)]|nr:hypothetical protein H8356DRAFT_1434372 [Neocallimastix sp. JGI-2020a]